MFWLGMIAGFVLGAVAMFAVFIWAINSGE